MTINQIRSKLYRLAKILGHVQSVNRAIETGSPDPIVRRVERVYAGKLTSRLLGAMFPPVR